MSDQPIGWTRARIISLISPEGLFTDGDWVESKDQDPNGQIRLLQLADIGDGRFLDKSARFISAEKFVELRCTELRPGDVLVARMPDPLGRACLMPRLPQRCITVVDVAAIRPGGEFVHPQWLMHAINAPQFRELMAQHASGTTRKRISRGNLAEIPMPVPPLAEQKRIADKVSIVLARVDGCRYRLTRIAPLIKRFRQSVLAAATSGRLTEDWRLVNPATLSWRDTTLGTVILDMRNGLSPKPRETAPGSKILRISAVRPGRIDFADHRFLEVDAPVAALYQLRGGDLLFTRYNGSLDFVGVCAVVQSDQPGFIYPDKLIRVRVDDSQVLPKFVEMSFASHSVRKQVEDFVKSSAGQKGVSGGDLKTTRFALPSLVEQAEIVQRVETLFAFTDRLEAGLAKAHTAVDRLTPSLLAKAFRGELVPQDPADEPATELLKRLQAKATEMPPAGRSRRRAAAAST